MDSKRDTEMLKFLIGYCSGHFIFPVFLNALHQDLIRFLAKEKLYSIDLSNKNRFFVWTLFLLYRWLN